MILEATINDIAELSHVEIQSKVSSIPNLFSNEELDFDSRILRWENYFARKSPQTSKPERVVLKATNESGEIIGYIAAHLTNRFQLDAEIQSFYILKHYQRKGLGQKLFNEVLDWLKSNNAKSVCVGIHPENFYKNFYLKNGAEYLNEHWLYWKNVSS